MNNRIARGTVPGRVLAPLGIPAPLWWVLNWALRKPSVRWSLVFVGCTLMVVATAWCRLPGAMALFVILTLLVGLSGLWQLGR